MYVHVCFYLTVFQPRAISEHPSQEIVSSSNGCFCRVASKSKFVVTLGLLLLHLKNASLSATAKAFSFKILVSQAAHIFKVFFRPEPSPSEPSRNYPVRFFNGVF